MKEPEVETQSLDTEIAIKGNAYQYIELLLMTIIYPNCLKRDYKLKIHIESKIDAAIIYVFDRGAKKWNELALIHSVNLKTAPDVAGKRDAKHKKHFGKDVDSLLSKAALILSERI